MMFTVWALSSIETDPICIGMPSSVLDQHYDDYKYLGVISSFELQKKKNYAKNPSSWVPIGPCGVHCEDVGEMNYDITELQVTIIVCTGPSNM